MNLNPRRIRKIDAIIVVALIVISVVILFDSGYFSLDDEKETPEISFIKNDEDHTLRLVFISGDHYSWDEFNIEGNCNKSELYGSVTPNDIISECFGEIVLIYKLTDEIVGSWTFEEDKPPKSFFLPNKQVVSPDDEGKHYDKLFVNREWWTWTAVFDQYSDLAGWTMTISFMHLARGDLGATFEPDALVLTLNSPDGKEFGGIINKKRGLLLSGPTLEAKSSGVELSFEDSWAEGSDPEWTLYVEDDDIDKDHDIIVDVTCKVESNPIWTNDGLLDIGNRNIASYIYTGVEITGKIKIDGEDFSVSGIGHHHHAWSNTLSKTLFKGWDFCHIKSENGWNIYYSKYYLTSEKTLSSDSKINPFANVIVTADNGKTITELKNIELQTESKSIFGKVKIPVSINIQGEPDITQPLLTPYGIKLDLQVETDNIYEKVFNSVLNKVGVNIGRAKVNGNIIWSEDNTEYDINLKGIGCLWTMRR